MILQLPRLSDHFVTFWACVLGGFIPATVAIAPTYRQRGAVVGKLANTWSLLEGPWVVTDASLRQAITGLEELLSLDGLRVLVFEGLVGAAEADPRQSRPDEVAFYQLTSQHRRPKCIQETHRGILAHVFASSRHCGLSASDVV